MLICLRAVGPTKVIRDGTWPEIADKSAYNGKSPPQMREFAPVAAHVHCLQFIIQGEIRAMRWTSSGFWATPSFNTSRGSGSSLYFRFTPVGSESKEEETGAVPRYCPQRVRHHILIGKGPAGYKELVHFV